MLVDYRPSWTRIFAQIGRPLGAAFLFACATSLVYLTGSRAKIFSLPDLPLSLFSAALGLLLGFRTNSAYDRWWEARTLWGGIVNQSRNWARQVLSMPTPCEDSTRFAHDMVYAQIAFVHALRRHLRAQDALSDLGSLLPDQVLDYLKTQRNVPAALLHLMGMRTAELLQQGLIGENRFIAMQATLTELTNLQGGCERIRNTPLPRQYDYWPEWFVYAYCFLLPLAIVQELGWVTPVITLVVGFIFLVLNRIGRNLEDPFHSIVYGTPLTSLCFTIEANLRQQLGETNVPPALEPVGGVLE